MRSELKSKVKSHLVGMWDLNSDLRGYKSKTGDFNGGTQGFSETKEAIEVALATEATVAIEAIEAIQAWGACWRSRRVQTLLVRFLLAPLEFPKLANAQPSNFGPLRMFCYDCFPAKITNRPISARVFVYVLSVTENLTGNFFEKQQCGKNLFSLTIYVPRT